MQQHPAVVTDILFLEKVGEYYGMRTKYKDTVLSSTQMCRQTTHFFTLYKWTNGKWRPTHRQRVLSNLTAGQSHEVRRIEPLIHGRSLAGVNNKEQLVIPEHKHTTLMKQPGATDYNLVRSNQLHCQICYTCWTRPSGRRPPGGPRTR